MRKIVMEGPKKGRIIDVPVPEPGAGQLLVKVKYTGMCHSDWYPWRTATAGMSLGHEPMGTVAEVGPGVNGFKAGDRVSGLGGGYSEYILMDEALTVCVPDNVADEDAVAEPLSCLLSAASKMPIDVPGDSVAVVGAGYMGLGIISLFRLKGAGRIVAVDPREEARANALRFGATEVYAPDELPDDYRLDWRNWGSDDLTRSGKPLDIFHTGFRTVMEFAGTESGLRLAGDMVSAHGLLGIGGYHNDADRGIDFKLWNVKAITAVNCHERRTDFQVRCCQNALELLSSGRWDFTGLSRHIYTMEELDRGHEDMERKPRGFVKGLVLCSE